MPSCVRSKGMAEPHPKSGSLQIHVSYSFDRLLEPKLAQAYDILVPCRERPVGVHVKEFDDENGGHLRTSLVRATARGEHHCEPNCVADRVRQEPPFGSARRVGRHLPARPAYLASIRWRTGLGNLRQRGLTARTIRNR